MLNLKGMAVNRSKLEVLSWVAGIIGAALAAYSIFSDVKYYNGVKADKEAIVKKSTDDLVVSNSNLNQGDNNTIVNSGGGSVVIGNKKPVADSVLVSEMVEKNSRSIKSIQKDASEYLSKEEWRLILVLNARASELVSIGNYDAAKEVSVQLGANIEQAKEKLELEASNREAKKIVDRTKRYQEKFAEVMVAQSASTFGVNDEQLKEVLEANSKLLMANRANMQPDGEERALRLLEEALAVYRKYKRG